MPCDKCVKKFSKLATPDVKLGHERAVAANKLIEKKSKKDRLYVIGSKCESCKVSLHIQGKLCAACAHRTGKCHVCGKRIFDTSKHVMSMV